MIIVLLFNLLIRYRSIPMKIFFVLPILFAFVGCASITNDSMIPLTLTFSNGENGKCKLRNKRFAAEVEIPSTTMVRRSDDVLVYECTTDSGKESYGNITSENDALKFGTSILFFDLGITDAITDKHRTYQSNIVIPVKN